MKPFHVIIASSCLLPALVQAQDVLTVGKPSPALGPSKLYQAPAGATPNLEALKGKVVVLEFWATWCAPCISQMPHMNELAQTLKDEPIQFISVSNEEPEKVEKFLTKGLLKTWVASAPEAFKNFGVTFIPRTVVLDREGRVALVTSPSALKEETLRSLIQGKSISVDAPRIIQASTDREAGVEPLYQLTISPADGSAMMTMANPNVGIMEIQNATIPALISTALGVTQSYLLVEHELPAQRHSLRAKLPGHSRQQFMEGLEAAIENAFGLEIAREKRQKDVLILTSPSGPKGDLSPSTSAASKFSTSPGVIAGQKAALSSLVNALQAEFGQIVVDDSGLSGAYDLLLTFTEGDAESLKQALASVGLDLKQGVREVEVVVVRKKSGL